MRAYYRCKECSSKGSIQSHKKECPVCGSRYLKFYKSEGDCIKRGGKLYEKCYEA